MLPLLFHVHQVSALVPHRATAVSLRRRRRTARAALTPPRATLARAPGLPELADAHPTPHRRRLAPPPPARAAPPPSLLSAAAARVSRAGRPAAWGCARRPHRAAAAALPRRPPPLRASPPPLRRRAERHGARLDRPPLCFVSLASRAHGSGVMGGFIYLFILLNYSAVDCKFHINSRKNAKNMK